MDKYIGFDMDSKKTVCCVVESGQKDKYRTIGGGHKYQVGSIAVPSQKIRVFSEIDQSK